MMMMNVVYAMLPISYLPTYSSESCVKGPSLLVKFSPFSSAAVGYARRPRPDSKQDEPRQCCP